MEDAAVVCPDDNGVGMAGSGTRSASLISYSRARRVSLPIVMSLRPVSISESREREMPVAFATWARENPRAVRIARSVVPNESS